MQDKEQIKARLKEAGYSIIHEYDDGPGEVFPDHTHPTDQHIVVIRGQIEITMSGETWVVNPGGEMFFPANVVHSAKVGPEGCLYLDGEKPET